MDQAQLNESLQQQQNVTQQMLDVLNEKIENWVCQCFSDLRNRIIELVSITPPMSKSSKQMLLSCLLDPCLLDITSFRCRAAALHSCCNKSCRQLLQSLPVLFIVSSLSLQPHDSVMVLIAGDCLHDC